MTLDLHDTLTRGADDAELRVVELHDNRIVLSISMPSCGGETWLIRSENVVHLDMAPRIMLGSIEFGGLEILPPNYVDTRDIDYGGEPQRYRVLHFIDMDEKDGYLILYDNEEIIRKASR
ncbi:MAG: hypothetical protein QGG25_12580 [Phycisphaerae bacterium]|jgi:hypothetical protein|nr:hypothetical protein [Phycisphaerae bacterium]